MTTYDGPVGLMCVARALRSLTALFLLAVCLAAAQDAVPKSASANDLAIPAGMQIQLSSTQEIDSKKLRPGDQLSFVLTKPLVVHGRLLARDGTPVRARVTAIRKPAAVLEDAGLDLHFADFSLMDGTSITLAPEQLAPGDVYWSAGGAVKAIGKMMIWFTPFSKGEQVHIHKGETIFGEVRDSTSLNATHFAAEVPAAATGAVAEVIISHYTSRFPMGYGDVYCGTVRIHKTGLRDAFKVQLKPGTYWFSGEYGPPLHLTLEAGQREYLALRSVGVDQDPRHIFHIETAKSRHSFLIQSSEAEYERTHTSAPIKKVISLVDADPAQLTAKPADRPQP